MGVSGYHAPKLEHFAGMAEPSTLEDVAVELKIDCRNGWQPVRAWFSYDLGSSHVLIREQVVREKGIRLFNGTAKLALNWKQYGLNYGNQAPARNAELTRHMPVKIVSDVATTWDIKLNKGPLYENGLGIE